MNETRKKIIELIEPYMNKELSEGCILYCQGLYNEKYADNTPYEVIQDHSILSDGVKKWNEYRSWRNGNEKKFKSFIELGKEGPLRIVNKVHKGEICYSQKEYGATIKILGHYDITAVLKYMDSKNCFSTVFDQEWIEVKDTFNEVEHGEIPNKPLHLYTEQEEKDLLKLLKQLGN